jgi:hypothetical protein
MKAPVTNMVAAQAARRENSKLDPLRWLSLPLSGVDVYRVPTAATLFEYA